MTTFAETGWNLIKRGADAAVATAGVATIASFGAYEWVARETNYYDAPMICGGLALGVPFTVAGGVYAVKRGGRALADLDWAAIQARVYGGDGDGEAVDPGNWLTVTQGIDRIRRPRFPIGRNVAAGGVVAIDFDETPHLLISGQTGSGKTMSVLRPLAAMAAVSGLFQVIILDRSGRNFRILENHPNIHIYRYQHRNMPEIAKSGYEEVMRRDRWLSTRPGNPTTVDRARADRRPPRVLVIVDEYANMAGLLKNEDRTEYGRLTTSMIQIAQEGRAMSVHLALVAQRPDHNQINTTLRSQLDGITFRMRDATDARLADAPGSEDLPAGQAILSRPTGYTTAAMFKPSDGEIRQMLAMGAARENGAPSWLYGYETADPDPDQAAAGAALPAQNDVTATFALDREPVTRPATPQNEAVTGAPEPVTTPETVTDSAESVTGYSGQTGRDLGTNPGETQGQAEKVEPVTPVTPVTPEMDVVIGARVRELLTDDDPSEIDGLTIGEVQSITLCLMYGESLSGTCRIVWNGKNGRYMDAVKTVRERLAGALGAGE